MNVLEPANLEAKSTTWTISNARGAEGLSIRAALMSSRKSFSEAEERWFLSHIKSSLGGSSLSSGSWFRSHLTRAL